MRYVVAVQRCGVATLDRILRCWWIPARGFEVKAESEEGVLDDKKDSQLEVRGGILYTGCTTCATCCLGVDVRSVAQQA